MQHNLATEINQFKKDVYDFENKQQNELTETIGLIESINPVELKPVADHLRKNLDGLMNATSAEEVKWYQDSFKKTLASFAIDTDVLDLVQLFHQIRLMMDVAQDQSVPASTQSKILDSFISDFHKKEENLLKAINNRLEEARALRAIKEPIETDPKAPMKEIDKSAELSKYDSQIAYLNEAKIKIGEIRRGIEEIKTIANRSFQQVDKEDFLKERAAMEQKMQQVRQTALAQQELTLLEKHLADMANKRIDALAKTRHSYLEEAIDYKMYARNFTWMGVGAAVIAVSLALVALPAVILGLGIAGLVYGAVDLAKSVYDVKQEHEREQFGKRYKAQNIDAAGKVIKKPRSRAQRTKKVAKTSLPVTLSLVGLGLGVAALIPGVNIGVAIGLGVTSLVVGVGAAIFYGHKFYKQYKAKQAAKKQHAALQKEFEQVPVKPAGKTTPTTTMKVEAKKTQALSSDAVIDLFLVGHRFHDKLTPEQKVKLAKEVNVNTNEDKPQIEMPIEKKTEPAKKEEPEEREDEGEAPHRHP